MGRRVTGKGHVRFGGGLSQKYCPDGGRQLGGSLPNLRQVVKGAGDRLSSTSTEASQPFCGAKPDIDWQDPAARKAHLGELVAAARSVLDEVREIKDPAVAARARVRRPVVQP